MHEGPQAELSYLPCSIMLNILGEADGEEGLQRAHEVMARAYAVNPSLTPLYITPLIRNNAQNLTSPCHCSTIRTIILISKLYPTIAAHEKFRYTPFQVLSI